MRALPAAGTDRLTVTLAVAPDVAILHARHAGHLVGGRGDREGLPGPAGLPLVEDPDEAVRRQEGLP